MSADFDAGLAVGWMRGYQAAMDAVALTREAQAMDLPMEIERIAAIYADCHHTKYVGCRPCPHDLAVRELERECGLLPETE